jgi:serine/threonine protein kinase
MRAMSRDYDMAGDVTLRAPSWWYRRGHGGSGQSAMSTEPRRVAKPVADWTTLENQVVNGRFPLRRFIATSRHSVVFLTEYKGADAAIKLIPADPSRAHAQLAQWEAASALTHPHLLPLYETGRCRLGGRELLFVVMEYAEQTLAQILTLRALSADEVREMLPAMLDALAFLHESHYVHAQLKPSNILAVGDQLKLSTDTVRASGNAPGVVRTSLYDPPELRDGIVSPTGDIWAFGMALVEALSQRTWKGARGQGETTTSLLASLPEPFEETARRCLSRSPADRPTAADLQAQFMREPRDVVISDEVTLAPEEEDALLEAQDSSETPPEVRAPQSLSFASLSLRAIVLAFLLFLGAWVVLRS